LIVTLCIILFAEHSKASAKLSCRSCYIQSIPK